MNQQSNALVSIIVAAVIMLIISVAVYFIGTNFIEPGILATQDLSKGSVLSTDWEGRYFILVRIMGGIAGAILILWTILTHWVFNPASSSGIGKRWIWVLLLIILVAACVQVPYIFAERYKDTIIINENIPILFGIAYGLFGYWAGSILVTSDDFRYTPIFAIYFR